MTPGRRRRIAAAAVLVAVLVGGCRDGDKDKGPSGGASGGTASTAADGSGEGEAGGEDDGHGHTEPTLVDPATGKQGKISETDKYSAVAPPPESTRAPDVVITQGDITLAASVQPGCVEHGKQVVAVFRSEPGITVVAQIKWPNDAFSGLDSVRGTTGADGTFRWTVDVKPTALYGVADLQAAAIDERPEGRRRKGTSGNWEFVVAPPGRC